MASFADGTIEMVQGRARAIRFTVTNRTTGLPVDISTWAAFWFTAKRHPKLPDSAAAFIKTLVSGVTVLDAANGLVEVIVEAADTAGIDNSSDTYDAEFQGRDSAARPWPLWQGKLVFNPHLTEAS